MTKVVALAGGVGGAKLVYGLAKILPPDDLTVIVNTGDDFVHFGLNISPDLDTVMYNLADLSNEETGWGRKNETWNCFTELENLETENWFRLGDRDLATHLQRTKLLKSGLNLSDVTSILCKKNGVHINVRPMTDDIVHTIVTTKEYGDLPFQEYFVKHKFEPRYMWHIAFSVYIPPKLTLIRVRLLQNADVVITMSLESMAQYYADFGYRRYAQFN